MISLSDIYKGMKAASALFAKFSDTDRAAARKQAVLLDHLAEDMVAIRNSLNTDGRIDPFSYARYKLAARAAKEAVPDLLTEIGDAEALVDSIYKSGPGTPPSAKTIDQIAEYAGAFKGTARTLLTLSEPNK